MTVNCKNGLKTNGRKDDGTFAPGNSGRPRGARHKGLLDVEALLEGQAETLTQKAAEALIAELEDAVGWTAPCRDYLIRHNFGERSPHDYVGRDTPITVKHATVYLDFPCMKIGQASLNYRHEQMHGNEIIGPVRPKFWCCNGDREAFDAFVDSVKTEGA